MFASPVRKSVSSSLLNARKLLIQSRRNAPKFSLAIPVFTGMTRLGNKSNEQYLEKNLLVDCISKLTLLPHVLNVVQ